MERPFYTADEFSNMSVEETEKILRTLSPMKPPTLEQLEALDVGLYDEEGNLIGEKLGYDDDYY